jgi:chorismate-pyruvate lyase
LLTTDGTVTDILEAYLFEQIQVVKLSEELMAIAHLGRQRQQNIAKG